MIVSKTAQQQTITRRKNKVISLSIPERQAIRSGKRVFFEHTKVARGTYWRVVTLKSGQFVSSMPTEDELNKLKGIGE